MSNNSLQTINSLVTNKSVRARFEQVLGRGADTFIGSLVSLTNGSRALQTCDQKTILSAAMIAATLKLPINPSLGLAYIVPYGGKATFQLGWRGINQLAMRSGQYQRINVSAVHEGEIKGTDFITGDLIRGKKVSDKVIGYVAYFRLVNGFEKTLYMSVEEMQEHARTYSQSYRSGRDSVWRTNFDAMAKKTVLKLLLSRYGIMSVEMQNMDLALRADQSVVTSSVSGQETFDYVDNKDDNAQVQAHADAPSKKEEGNAQNEQDDDAILDAVLEQSEKQYDATHPQA